MSINERIEKLIKHFGLSASAFADSIGIQRPSMSHILSGRNKASLDVVQKVLEAYPDVSSDWLISGSGSMIVQAQKETNKVAKEPEASKNNNITNVNSEKAVVETESKPDLKEEKPLNNEVEISKNVNNDDIEKIVIFYKDGTFKVYFNK